MYNEQLHINLGYLREYLNDLIVRSTNHLDLSYGKKQNRRSFLNQNKAISKYSKKKMVTVDNEQQDDFEFDFNDDDSLDSAM
jgi:hypothetical protein